MQNLPLKQYKNILIKQYKMQLYNDTYTQCNNKHKIIHQSI